MLIVVGEGCVIVNQLGIGSLVDVLKAVMYSALQAEKLSGYDLVSPILAIPIVEGNPLIVQGAGGGAVPWVIDTAFTMLPFTDNGTPPVL